MKSITNELKKSINKIIYSTQGNTKGRLTEITYNANNDPQYAIIATNYMAGGKERYFALPVLSVFIELTKNGNIAFNLEDNDMVLAKRVRFEDCPTMKENDFFPSIYEVYGYIDPTRN